jgi:hypothetical protein
MLREPIDLTKATTGQNVIFQGVGLVAKHTCGGNGCVPPLFLTDKDIDCMTGKTLYDHLYKSISECYRKQGVQHLSKHFWERRNV